MRPLPDGLCALAIVLIAAGSAAAKHSAAPAHVSRGDAQPPGVAVACLGGVLNQGPAGGYLTVADYPAFAAVAAGLQRIFICGDSIPSFLPPSEQTRSTSRHR